MASFHDFEVVSIDGDHQSLADYRGKTVLVVNVASECGMTPQYTGLEKLQREFGDQGFNVLGLPCNQFGAQEPGSEAEIKSFCSSKYDVSFPMTSKIDVNGENRHPLYTWLTTQTGGEDISWNFEKFLVDGNGSIVQRFGPKIPPEDEALRAAVEKTLRN